MTTMFSQEQTCALCGKTSTQNVLGSTNTMGPSDLDMRPAPMARWTLDEQVQCCPHCDYCAWDISEATEAAGEIVANDSYRVELARESVPELTRRYLCASLILSADGKDAEAGQAALMGAWAADDAASREAASRCRRFAIAYLEADRERGLTFAEDEATADALLADLHRRVGDFEAARALARAGMAREPEGLLLDVLRFEVELAESEDASCHNLGEVGEDEEFTIIMPG
ncbi:MAG: hypothetical protein JXA57_02910 [Armatimonadetes bacterium]|nr:hypothetical protein [Armatimonadota bacterium]